MPGANVFAYDGTSYKPTDLALTAAISTRTASGYVAVTYCYQLSKPAAVTVATGIWQGFPPIPSQVTFAQSTTGTAPDSVNRTTISWTCDASATLSRFELYRQVGSGAFASVSLNIAANLRSFVVDSHDANTAYTYFVKSVAISNLTQSGATGSFTLTPTSSTGVSIASTGTITSSSITWRATVPQGVFQKIWWFNRNALDTAWDYVTSSTLASNATTADYARSSLAENTSYGVAFVLFNYNNHATFYDVTNTDKKFYDTANQAPGAGSISALTTGPLDAGAVPVGDGRGYATIGAVKKFVTASYTLAVADAYSSHTVFLWSGPNTVPVTSVASQSFVGGASPGSGTVTFSNLDYETKYWVMVRQIDTYGAFGDSGWSSITTPTVFGYVNVAATNPQTGISWTALPAVAGPYGDISYLEDATTISSNYGSEFYSGSSVDNAVDNNNSTYCAWRVANATAGNSGSVGTIQFQMSDIRYSNFLKYFVNGAYVTTNAYVHNVAVQFYGVGQWWGSVAANSVKTRNGDVIVYDSAAAANSHDMTWAGIYGLGWPARNLEAAGDLGMGSSGNGGTSNTFYIKFSLRNPVGFGSYYVFLSELNHIDLWYTRETSSGLYNSPTAAVYRYY